MTRITTTVASVAIICEFLAKPAPAQANASLVSAWQYCEPGKGCSKFAFMPNGQVIEQFPLSGSLVTAYGHYHVRGEVLKIGWKRFAPTQICRLSPSNMGSTGEQCWPTTQSDFKGPFHFEGLDTLVWLKPDQPPLRLLRIKL